MTRETKIGLLVGLAFIIIVGILLSEPLSHSNDAQPAQLPIVGANVRAGVTTPGSTQPPISVVDTGNVSPRQPVPTQREISNRNSTNNGVISVGQNNGYRTPGHTDVIVSGNPPRQPVPNNDTRDLAYPLAGSGGNGNGGSGNTGGGTVTLADGSHATGSIDIGSTLSNGGRGPRPDPRDSGIPGELAREAARNGVELVPANGNQNRGAHTNATPAGSKQYTAGPGDSVSKIASKFYGSNSKVNRDAIIQANPSLQQDPNKIISGRTYIIPNAGPTGGNAPGTGTPAVREPSPPIRANATPPVVTPTASAGSVYTVKDNDSLWRIARDQCGDPGAVAAIKELNKEVLAGGDQVRPNMKLRLPTKAVN